MASSVMNADLCFMIHDSMEYLDEEVSNMTPVRLTLWGDITWVKVCEVMLDI